MGRESPTKTFRTGDLVAAGKLEIGDGYRARNSELSSAGLPFARVGNIDGGFHFEGADRFPEDALEKVGDKVSQPGDVVFTSKGTVGRFAYVRESTPRFVFSPQLSYWRSLDEELIDPRYLFYWMQGSEFWLQAAGVKGQTDMADYVSLTDQRRMMITLPEIREQRAIADILGTLDDKIELNRRMNETLDEMARALFKSWFVNFDPVRAKKEARWQSGESLPGLPAELYNLFPARFVDSELGEVPEGWEVSRIGDEVDAVGGGTPSTKNPEYWDGGTIHWATPRDLSTISTPILLETNRSITEAGVERISSGRLPNGTVLLSSRAPVGYLAISEVPIAINQGFIAMVCHQRLGNHYILRWAEASMAAIKRRAGGTTFAEISKRNFRPIPVLVPPEPVHAIWHQQGEAWYQRAVNNVHESLTLANLRNTLLTPLLSGEVRVPNPKRLLDAEAP